jgi:TP901 family phage tail tape measure protein
MALNNMGGGIGITINLNINAPGATQTTTQVTQGLNQVASAGAGAAQSVEKFKEKFQQLAGEYNKMVVGQHLIGAVMGLVKITDEITAGMASIKTVITDAFDPQAAQRLKSVLMDVSETTGTSFKDMAAMTHELLSQGLSVGDVENLIGPLNKFITVGDISVDKATDLTVALTNMGISAKNAGEAYDVILNLANKTTIRAPEFVDVLTRAAPAANLAHQSFLELASSAALLRKSFSGGKQEATALFQTLATLERTKIQDKIAKAFGVDVAINKKTGELKPLLDIIQEVNVAIGKGHGSVSDLFNIFGSRTGAQVFAGGITTLQQGMELGGKQHMGQDLIDATRTEAGTSKGSVDQAFSVKMENFTAQVDRLKSALTDLLADSGGVIANALTNMVRGLTDLIQGFRHILELSPWIKDIFGILVSTGGKFALLAGGFLVVSAGVKIASAAFSSLRTSLFGVAAAEGVAAMGAKAFWKSLLGPIGLLLTVISMVSDIFSIFSEGEKAQDKSMSVADSLKQTSFANQTAADKLLGAAEALDEASQAYKELVVQYSAGLVTNFPTFDKAKDLPAIAAAVAAAPTTGLMTPEAAKVLGDQIKKIFTAPTLSGAEGNRTLNEAARALQTLGGAAAAAAAEHQPGAAAAVKVFDTMLKTFEAMAKKNAVQLTSDTQQLVKGYNPTTEELTPLPSTLRAQNKQPHAMKLSKGAIPQSYQLQDQITREFQAHETLAGLPKATGHEVYAPSVSTIIDRPIELKVDGSSLDGTLRSRRQQDKVEGLR